MTFDQKAGLLGSNLLGEQCAGYVDISEMPTNGAVHVIVPVSAAVESTGLVTERKLQNDPVFSQQVEGSIDRSIGDRRVLCTYTLEYLAGSHVRVCRADLA